MEWLNFRHLFAFWSVCRFGGFQKAANKIHVSQSALSEQVAELEQYLDEHLLERTTRSLRVTPRGEELLRYADEIFRKSQAINHIFKDKNESLVPSQIRIGMSGGISRNLLYRVINQSFANESGTQIQVVDGSLEELNDMLRSFEIDLVFALERPKRKDLSYLAYQEIESSPLCMVAKPEVIRRIKKSKRSGSWDSNVFLFNHLMEGDVIEDFIHPQFNVNCRVSVTTDDISLLRFLANSGRGIAIMPEIGVQEDLMEGRVSRVRLSDVPLVEFYAIYLKSGYHRELIDEFLA